VIFTVVIRDKNGCSNETLQAHILTYPKFFTPNNDGIMMAIMIWEIVGLVPEMQSILSILDIYDKLIKVIRLEDVGWYSTFNGFNLSSDDYWSTIEYTNLENASAIFKSHFALIR
jgi:gliding motility-associated-like protein